MTPPYAFIHSFHSFQFVNFKDLRVLPDPFFEVNALGDISRAMTTFQSDIDCFADQQFISLQYDKSSSSAY